MQTSSDPSRPSVFPSAPEWALLVDGSALFFGQRRLSPDKIMDYHALADVFHEESGYRASPSPAFFFTATDESNKNQLKFNDMISAMGWAIRSIPPAEANVINPMLFEGDATKTSVMRFDAVISYSLGRLVGAEPRPRKIVVVSDSWPLHLPIMDVARAGVEVLVTFFGSILDPRWLWLLGGRHEGLHFLDLDKFSERLFARQRRKSPFVLFEK